MADDRIWVECVECNKKQLLLKKLGYWSLWPDTDETVEKTVCFFRQHDFHKLVITQESTDSIITL